jgi:uncharacterized protein (TIGR02996 family)
MLEDLLRGIVEDPDAEDRWLVLADWLEENDDPRRAEFLRLHRSLLATCLAPELHPERSIRQERMVELLTAGISPCVPQRTIRLTSTLEMKFSWIPPGTFLMGSLLDEPGRDPDEGPQHRVTITHGFWLADTPVTQGQWRAVADNNPSRFRGRQRPVESVSWEECQDFCRRLRTKNGQRFRLPTEAEWELACRAGTTTPYYTGAGVESLKKAGWCSHSGVGTARETRAVRRFLPNFWGLYDMHGNVWEWCSDWCDEFYYQHTPTVDPSGPDSGVLRMLRGGSWWEEPRYSRSTHRCWYDPNAHYDKCGCRLVLCPE